MDNEITVSEVKMVWSNINLDLQMLQGWADNQADDLHDCGKDEDLRTMKGALLEGFVYALEGIANDMGVEFGREYQRLAAAEQSPENWLEIIDLQIASFRKALWAWVGELQTALDGGAAITSMDGLEEIEGFLQNVCDEYEITAEQFGDE